MVSFTKQVILMHLIGFPFLIMKLLMFLQRPVTQFMQVITNNRSCIYY